MFWTAWSVEEAIGILMAVANMVTLELKVKAEVGVGIGMLDTLDTKVETDGGEILLRTDGETFVESRVLGTLVLV